MNKVYAKLIGNLFIYGVLVFMGYLTYQAVINATGDPVIATMAIMLFDGGAYAGYVMFIGHAEGAHQRATAQGVLVIDFLLAVAMVAGGLTLIPSTTILWVMLFSAIFNGAAGYYYKTHDPDTLQAIAEREIADAQFEEALKRQRDLHKIAQQTARLTLEREGPALGAILARRATAQIKSRMRLALTTEERAEWEGETVDAIAQDVPQLPAPAPRVGVWDWLRSFLSVGMPQAQPSVTMPITQPTDSNSGEPPQPPADPEPTPPA